MEGKLSTLGLMLCVAPLLAGCGLFPVRWLTGSGNVVTQEFDLAGFDKVDVSHAFTVDISEGEAFSVIIRIDDNLAQYLEVVKRGSTLKIGLKPRISVTNATMEAEVTMPELTGLDLSGASHGTITGFESTKALDVDVSGASHLAGDIEAGDTRFDASGASHVTLSGSAQDVTIDASGASHVNLADFTVADANVEASGASHVTVNASGRLDVEASGASHVYYLGSPTLGKVDSSGASSIERK